MWPNPQETANLVTFTEEILNGKLHFLYSVNEYLKTANNEIDDDAKLEGSPNYLISPGLKVH